MSTYTIPLPWAKPPLTGNRTRGNPYARGKEVAEAKDQARYAIRTARLPHIVGAEITLTQHVTDKRRRDADNLAPTLKVVQDALVAEGVFTDDSWVTIPSATCRIEAGEWPSLWLTLEEIQ